MTVEERFRKSLIETKCTSDDGTVVYDAMTRVLAALTAALSEQVVVPKEPTPEMIAAWYHHKNGFHFAGDPPPGDTSDYGAYRAMIAAAPPPVAPAGESRSG